MGKELLLDRYIEVLSAQFPQYDYVNGIREYCRELESVEDDFAIVVFGIKSDDLESFVIFVRDILYHHVGDGDELPAVYAFDEPKC